MLSALRHRRALAKPLSLFADLLMKLLGPSKAWLARTAYRISNAPKSRSGVQAYANLLDYIGARDRQPTMVLRKLAEAGHHWLD